MGKPIPRRLASDDCAVDVDGTTYYPHEGEWVEIVGSQTVGELQAFTALAAIGTELTAMQGDVDETQRATAAMDKHFHAVCVTLSRRIVAWNWTDMQGEPLPSPRGNPAIFAALTTDELYYLVRVARGERPGDRKND